MSADSGQSSERLDRTAEALSRLLRFALSLAAGLSCLLFFSYCIRIGFIPTDLEFSQLLTGLFLLFAFGLAYLAAALFMYLVGAPFVLLPVAWFVDRKLRSPEPIKHRRWYLRVLSQHQHDRGLEQYYSWACSALCFFALLYCALKSFIGPWFLLRIFLFSAALSFMVHSFSFIYRTSRRFPRRSKRPARKTHARELLPVVAITAALPLFALGTYAGIALDMTMEAARLRVRQATIRIPAYAVDMLPPNMKLVGDIRPLNDGTVVVDDATVYLHRIGSDAYLGLHAERVAEGGAKERRVIRTTVANSSLVVLDSARDQR